MQHISVSVADAFTYEIMCQGKDKLNYYMQDYKEEQRLPEQERTGCHEGHEDRAGDVCPRL